MGNFLISILLSLGYSCRSQKSGMLRSHLDEAYALGRTSSSITGGPHQRDGTVPRCMPPLKRFKMLQLPHQKRVIHFIIPTDLKNTLQKEHLLTYLGQCKSQAQRSLAGCGPWSHKEWDMPYQLKQQQNNKILQLNSMQCSVTHLEDSVGRALVQCGWMCLYPQM